MTTLASSSPTPNEGAKMPLSGSTVQPNALLQVGQADALIRSALKGILNQWPDVTSAPAPPLFVERVDFHGVAGLIATALEGGVTGVPNEVATAFKERRLNYLFWEDRHRFFIGSAIDALAEAEIDVVVIKGTASAYSLYGTAANRVRGDTDILIAPRNQGHADEILVELGFERMATFARSRGASQIGYTRSEGIGWSHDVDLHWQINNSVFLSQLFSWKEVFSRSIPLLPLCDAARAPCHVDSLLITCFHRLVHLKAPYTVNGTKHYNADRLIWLKDIDLLSQELTEDNWVDLVTRAREKGLARICLSGLTSASSAFGSKVPQEVLRRLAESSEDTRIEAYLYGKSSTRFRLNLGVQSGIRGKVAFIGEHIFPPAKYMRSQFGDGPLPALYLRRGIRGLGKLLPIGSRKL